MSTGMDWHVGLRLIVLLALLFPVESQSGVQTQPCKPVYVRWARASLDQAANVKGPFSLEDCQRSCTENYHPQNKRYHLPCAAFNFHQGREKIDSKCHLFQEKQLFDMDHDIIAREEYSFYRKFCVETAKDCKSIYHYDLVVDSYMDVSEVARTLSAGTVAECLALCLNEQTFTCRSASFNRTGDRCLLSPHNRLSKPGFVQLNTNPNFRIDYYENNCYNDTFIFNHECEETGINVKVESKYEYSGVLYGLYDYFHCQTQPQSKKNFKHFFEFPPESQDCAESFTKEGSDVYLDVVLSTDGVQPLYFLTDQDVLYRARCPAPENFPTRPSPVGIASGTVGSVERVGPNNNPVLNEVQTDNRPASTPAPPRSLEGEGGRTPLVPWWRRPSTTPTPFVPWWQRPTTPWKVSPRGEESDAYVPPWWERRRSTQANPTQHPSDPSTTLDTTSTTELVPWWRRSTVTVKTDGDDDETTFATVTVPWWRRKDEETTVPSSTPTQTSTLSTSTEQITSVVTNGTTTTPESTTSTSEESTDDSQLPWWRRDRTTRTGRLITTTPLAPSTASTSDSTTTTTTTTTEPSTTTAASTSTASTTSTSTTTTTTTPATTTPLRTTPAAPPREIEFEFFNFDSFDAEPVDAVLVQKKVTMRASPGELLQVSPLQLSLVECTVEPTRSKFTYTPLKIIENGCPTDGVGLVNNIQIDQRGIAVQMGPLRYTDSAESLYVCTVRICKTQCPTFSCLTAEGQPYLSYGRRRRRRQISGPRGIGGGVQIPPSVVNPFTLPRLPISVPGFGSPGGLLPDGFGGLTDGSANQLSNWLGVDYRELTVRKRLVILNSALSLQYYMRTGLIPPEDEVQNLG